MPHLVAATSNAGVMMGGISRVPKPPPGGPKKPCLPPSIERSSRWLHEVLVLASWMLDMKGGLVCCGIIREWIDRCKHGRGEQRFTSIM